MVSVWHYDGTSAERHEAELTLTDDGFALRREDGHREFVRWTQTEARVSRLGTTVVGRNDRRGWQIGFPDGVPESFAPHMPRRMRYGGIIDRLGVVPSALIFGVVSALVLTAGIRAPDWIAPHVPLSFENRLGTAMLGDLSGQFCRGARGEAALAALVARVDPQTPVGKVHVIQNPMLNAVTLPGGTILIFDGLLQAAESADEIAGVLGHELGHVRHRDVMQALVRQAGLSVILGGFSGNIGQNMNSLLSASFSRTAESAADDHAITLLSRDAIDPRPIAALFDRLGKKGPRSPALAFLASHPVSAQRAAKFRSSYKAGTSSRDVITPEEWDDLSDLCRQDPARRSDYRGLSGD